MNQKMPSIVVVGRPNVGKSTLFNRLTGTRRSIVTDEPGITRDRIYGTATWQGRSFEIVDTGGLLPDDRAAIPREIFKQAQTAIAGATALVLVVDARAGATPLDLELARRLRRTGKPFVVAVNKVDTLRQEDLASQFYEIGAEIFPVSAEHGLGVDGLLDALTRDFPSAQEAESGETGDPEAPEAEETQVAIIGRPNVGKSTLLNQLAGAERSIVSAEPGTTRDVVDMLVTRGGKSYRFIDTAGIRRKGKTNLIAEKLSVIMARKHLERADVALLVADAALGMTGGDATIAGYAQQSGRSVIVVMNKWDLALQKARDAAQKAQKQRVKPVQERRGRNAAQSSADPERLAAEYETLVRERLKFLPYAPVIFVSALTGEHVEELYALIDRVAEARKRRITTGELNRWLATVDLARGTSPSAHRVKIYYMTQSAVSPPTFIIFTNQRQRLHFSYERFLENRLRAHFDFFGSPIRFIQRFRERGRDDQERPARKRRRAD
jgi:GTP-binding protein